MLRGRAGDRRSGLQTGRSGAPTACFPSASALAATFDPAFVQHRLSVPPGCTGLWQISPASAGLIGESPEYDLHYIHRWTVRLDLWILVRTVLTAAKKATHATLHDIPSWTGAHFHRHH